MLAAIQVLSRLECLGEMLRHALDTLARVAPDWLRAWVPAAWFDRYGQRFQDYRLPAGKAARTALAEQIGADGRQLLAAIHDPGRARLAAGGAGRADPAGAAGCSSSTPATRSAGGRPTDLPPAPLLLSTPYDPEARYSRKRATEWVGYKVHLTETCDEDGPSIITDVATTPAPRPPTTP